MNKYKEALDNVMKDNPKAKLTISDIHKDIRLLLELVLKETPKKLTTKKSDFLSSRTGEKLAEYILPFRYCPKCDKCVNPNYCDRPNYCSNCGQRLDWSE